MPHHPNGTEKQHHVAPGQFDVFPSYKGGHTTTYGGYVHEFAPGHPLASIWGFVAQHRLVGEDIVGRPLRKGEVVHHEDECRTNNDPANLRVMTQRQHRDHHNQRHSELMSIPLRRDEVVAALASTGSIKAAGRLLGCSHSTLRLRFPDLCAPYQRKSPTIIDNPRDIAAVLAAAPLPHVGLRELMQQVNMSSRTIFRLCQRHGVPWVKKARSDIGKPRQPKAIRA